MIKFVNYVIPVLLMVAIPIIGISSCFSNGDRSVPPLVITESSNVPEEALANQTAIEIPMENLGGDLGHALKQQFELRGTKPVLTSQDLLLNKPGVMVISLDPETTRELLTPELMEVLSGAISVAAPPLAPWVKLAGIFLPFLIPNFRKNVFNGVSRVTPGVRGPNTTDTGLIPSLSDLREGVVDLAKAFTLAKPDSPNVHTV